MKHYGDIKKIHGYEIEPVDIITGGSPCQDLSVAGKRAGLAGERSGLFMEQIRIIKEMREHDRNIGRSGQFIRPRYMVWENVPGTFSSNKGEDFRAVLEETVRVVDENAIIPEPPKEGWHKSGAIVGNGWSIAWRIHDAQYWGVPQRRKRLCLLADFNGSTAPNILFDAQLLRDAEDSESYETITDNRGESEPEIQPECESLSGDSEQSEEAWKGIAEGTGRSIDKPITYGISSYASNAMLSDNPRSGIYEAETSRTLDLNGGSPACNQGGVAVVIPLEGNGTRESHKGPGYGNKDDPCFTLNAVEHHSVMAVDARNNCEHEINDSLQSRAANIINANNVIRTNTNS